MLQPVLILFEVVYKSMAEKMSLLLQKYFAGQNNH